MEINQAKGIASQACDYFFIPTVRIVKCKAGRASYVTYNEEAREQFKVDSNEIRINPDKEDTGNDYALCHELAHHLCYSVHTNRLHDLTFYTCLVEMVRWYYCGKFNEYPWDKEYERIKKWYHLYGPAVRNRRIQERVSNHVGYRSKN